MSSSYSYQNDQFEWGPHQHRPFVRWLRSFYATAIGHEISHIARCYDEVIYWRPLPHDDGEVWRKIDAPNKSALNGPALWPNVRQARLLFLNSQLCYSDDIRRDLEEVRRGLNRTSRVALVLFNPLWRPLCRLLAFLGILPEPRTALSRASLVHLTKLSGYEITRFTPVVYCPLRLFGLGSIINAMLRVIPGAGWAGIATLAILRPIIPRTASPLLSVVIPARNEKGNIVPTMKALERCATMPLEVIFVEGGSDDGTAEEIEGVIARHKLVWEVRLYQQSGNGKDNAVALGIKQTRGDLIAILDADMTVDPGYLRELYAAYCSGIAEIFNGSRLVYPTARGAMRFCNYWGNMFFAKALSFTLDAPMSDSLCATKMFPRAFYECALRWQKHFGDYDPFGDFNLLFPAAALGFGIIEFPQHYLARSYGSTKIQRFRDGAHLARMVLAGLWRIKMGRGK